MSEESTSTTAHLSVAMTTTNFDKIQTTGGDSMTSSSSRGAYFYFWCAAVVIGALGAAANALVLYAMVVSKQHKKQLLIYNQNVFDLCSCLLLVLTYTLKLCNIYLTGTLGYWLCMMILNEGLLWSSVVGSRINLMSVTIERYLKVVRPACGKKLLRRPVRYAAIAFAWISSIIYNMAVAFSTSAVIDGVCYGFTVWESRVAKIIYGIWYFISFFVIVVLTFIFCYGSIFVVLRRQAKVMASHSGPGSSASQSHSNHVQSNVAKTMVLICALYVIMCTPENVYYLLVNVSTVLTLHESAYNVSLFTSIAFLYTSANPFIYAAKFEPVKRVLVGLIPCKEPQQADRAVEMT